MAFDLEYYQRFYFNRRTAVTSKAEMRARARLIASCVDYIGLPVSKILDAGCGVGLLRGPLLRSFKRAAYVGLEYSDYLSAAQARRAIANLSRLCRGALYFGALTREDWRENCDQTRTHRISGLRPGSWYRRELARAFRPLGCGMWFKRDLPLTFWNLDAA